MKFKLPKRELEDRMELIALRFLLKLQREVIQRIPARFRPLLRIEKSGDWQLVIRDFIFSIWELGSKPHDIDARLARALKFEWEDHPINLPPSPDGFHYFKRVRHPGTQGKRIFEQIVNDERLLDRLLTETLQELNI